MVFTLLARPFPANTRRPCRIAHINPRIRRKAQAKARRPGARRCIDLTRRGTRCIGRRRGRRRQSLGVGRCGDSRRGRGAPAVLRAGGCRARRRRTCRQAGRRRRAYGGSLMPRPPPNDAAHSRGNCREGRDCRPRPACGILRREAHPHARGLQCGCGRRAPVWCRIRTRRSARANQGGPRISSDAP